MRSPWGILFPVEFAEQAVGGLAARMMTMTQETSLRELLDQMVRSMVDQPDRVAVNEIEGQRSVVLELTVAPDDVAKVIGRRGAHAQALRTILLAAGGKRGKRCVLEIIEDQ